MNKISTVALVIGFSIGCLISGLFFAPEHTQQIAEIMQALTITFATLFTAWWTSKTFGHELRSSEAKELITILHHIRECLPDIVVPMPRTVDMDPTDFEKFMVQWEKGIREAEMNAWHRYNGYLTTLQEVTTKSVTIKPSMRMRLLLLGGGYTIKSVKEDAEKKLLKEVVSLQSQLAQSANFDISTEIIKIKRKFGIKI